MLSKNVNNKKCAPKLIFFNEKKIEKDSDNFWYRKLTLKVKRLGDFALFDTSPLTQFSKFNNFLWVCWFLGKNLSNFVPPVWKLHKPYCHTLRYEHGDKRPVKESLRMKLSGRQKSSLDSDALAEIKNQLTYFYTHSIVDAIKHAFLWIYQ